ncbi:NAD-dependent protein deacetylase [Aliikangiella coralliicola]|uniref:protein acetyllysine N-acetyltransferase n=1 Tax=Aliikangiella coralliicola TaxID=2592383 RepID=A0A545UG96_9GAMM|nr:NAD-dependent protein deacetylase [Aliikangiella coralliicola]
MQQLVDLVHQNANLFVLSGAGISVASGIPTYRDHNGQWQSNNPIQHHEFIGSLNHRKRYWARSALGWKTVFNAKPNLAHHSLAELEAHSFISSLVTQNVDRLHQKAGHKQVVDLHGRIDQAICLTCGKGESREQIQNRLLDNNPILKEITVVPAPDGDAQVSENYFNDLVPPECLFCGGVLKPDVVFFGGTVPKMKVTQASKALESAKALLVVGSSLMVYSGFRFCKLAAKMGKPIIVINQGKTRADDILTLKIDADCAKVLADLSRTLISQ